MKKNNSVKKQKKLMKKRKKEFIHYIKDNYNTYDAYFIIRITQMYIEHLYEYHKNGLNVWCAKDQHDQLMISLEYANELVERIKKIESMDDLYDPSTVDELNKELFKTIAEHYDEWWD